MAVPLLPPGQAVFGTVFRFSPKPWAPDKTSAAARLQYELDLLNRTTHPVPYRKPFMSAAPNGALLLAIENVHFGQAAADESFMNWAWQIAHQAGMSEHGWDATVEASLQVTPHSPL